MKKGPFGAPSSRPGTRRDLDEFRVATRRDIEELRVEMRHGFELLEQRIDTKLYQAINDAIVSQTRTILFALIGSNLTVGGLGGLLG